MEENQDNHGIGTTGPAGKLHVESATYPALRINGSQNDLAVQLYNTASGGRNYRIDSTATGSGHGGGNFVIVDDSAGSAERLKIASDGTLSGSATNDISDVRLKENITVVGSALEKITQLQGVRFTWKEEAKMTDRPQFGVLAQEVEAVFPELVLNDSIRGSDYKSVQYGGFVAPFIEAIKELKAENDALKTANSKLEARLAALEGKVK